MFRWLAKLGPPGALAAGLLKVAGVGAARGGPELPQVAGSLAAGDAIFLPLYDHFLTHGGVFRLNLGPKVSAPLKLANCSQNCSFLNPAMLLMASDFFVLPVFCHRL